MKEDQDLNKLEAPDLGSPGREEEEAEDVDGYDKV